MSPIDLSKLPTLADVAESRVGKAIPKGESRLQAKTAARKLTVVDDRQFKAIVWKRDKALCRCCGRKVIKTLARVAERGEVHHCHGRIGVFKFEDRASLLLCLTCHEKVTGRVNERLAIEPTATFLLDGFTVTDCRQPVRFVRVA